MNKIYLFLMLIGMSLTGCHEVTVGYMKTDYAAYSIDSLHIYDTVEIRREIVRLAAVSVSEYDSLEYLMDSLMTYGKQLNTDYMSQGMKVYHLESDLENLLEDSTGHVQEIIDLKKQIEVEGKKLELMEIELDDVTEHVNEIKAKLGTMDPEAGKAETGVLEKLKDLRIREGKPIPWITSEIEGVSGTAPIVYSIAGVRAEKGGDEEAFCSYLTIMGGGRLVVPYDFKAPAGYYHISITISNEGYSRTVEDAFTFIVN